MLNFKAATVVIGSLAGVVLPSTFAGPVGEAVQEHVEKLEVAASASRAEAKLPEFVSAENFSQFVEASRRSDAVPHDQGRLAAEQLIARITNSATTADSVFLHGVVEARRAEQAPVAVVDMVSSPDRLTNAGATNSTEQIPSDPTNASLDEAKVASVTADPEGPASDASRDSDPKKPVLVAAIVQPIPSSKERADPVTVTAGQRSFAIVSKRATGSVVRVKRKRVASAGANDVKDTKWGSPSGLLRGPTAPLEAHSDERAFGGPTQSMAPLISGCGHMTSACKANQAWCGC